MDFGGYFSKGVQITKLNRDTAGAVAADPAAFGPAVLFFAVGGLASGVGGTIGTGGAGFLMLLSGPVFAVISSFVTVGILHLLALLFGGTGRFGGYYSALGIGGIVAWAQVVPVLGHIVALWYLPVMVVVTERVHGISTARAILVVLIPALVSLILIVIAVALFGMSVFMSMMDTGGM